jgi:hypothetical protein
LNAAPWSLFVQSRHLERQDPTIVTTSTLSQSINYPDAGAISPTISDQIPGSDVSADFVATSWQPCHHDSAGHFHQLEKAQY